MGGATRFLVLIGAPFSLLRPQSTSFSLYRLSLRPLTLSPIKPIHTHSNCLQNDHHYQPQINNNYYYNQQQLQHPWPEWLKLLHTLSSPVADVHGIVPEDAFVSFDYLSDDFLRSAAYCLAFARNRPDILGLVSRKDIAVIVENGTPFLFQGALDTGRRMRVFLSGNTNALESDKAQTVDLMKYLLSYASNPSVSSERNNLYSRELIESSVRNLLNEFADVICGNLVVALPTPEQQQVSGYYGHTPRPLGKNIEMKKGDWICTRCNFMNFARNLQCLECEAARPKRQLNGGEWECPQCDFYNYSRNTACLRCDCRRPAGASFGTVNSGSVLGHNAKGDTSVSHSSNQILGRTSPYSETDSRNIGRLSTTTVTSDVPTSGYVRDGPSKGTSSGYVPFVPLPADMFAKKAQSSTMEDYQKAKPRIADSVSPVVNDQTGTVSVRDESGKPGDDLQLSENTKEVQKQNDKEQAVKSEGWFNRIAELHNVPDLTTAISDEEFPEIMPVRKGENRFVVSKKKDRSLTSPLYKRQSAMEQANDTKFVPFVPFPPDYFAKTDKRQPWSSSANVNSANETYSNSPSSVRSPAKSDNARRGETNWNREASTENQQIGRVNWSSNNSVNSEAPNTGYLIRNSMGYQGIDNDGQNVRYYGNDNNRETSTENQHIGRGNWSSNYSVNSEVPTTGLQIRNPMVYQGTNNDNQNVRYSGNDDNLSQTGPPGMGSPGSTTFNSQSRYPGRENAYQTGQPNAGNFSQNSPSTQPTSNSAGTTSNSPVNQNVRSGWSGKSLEGSAVKDPDPLDMSEEAKAERWFRRVAQIKDISELSRIPDEDFPSIMPMRKGVNRFVVSKRKTPLERRLTSPQYRRNLPVVSSDPVKDNDSS